jgi:hypothetical protein
LNVLQRTAYSGLALVRVWHKIQILYQLTGVTFITKCSWLNTFVNVATRKMLFILQSTNSIQLSKYRSHIHKQKNECIWAYLSVCNRSIVWMYAFAAFTICNNHLRLVYHHHTISCLTECLCFTFTNIVAAFFDCISFWISLLCRINFALTS